MLIWKLALSNINKHKSKSIALFILIFLCTILLNISLTVILTVNSLFDEKNIELKGAHFSTYLMTDKFEDKYEDMLKSHPDIVNVERENILFLSQAEIYLSKEKSKQNLILFNQDESREISPLTMVEELKNKQDNTVYLPYILKTGSGYRLGNSFSIQYNNIAYTYIVGGFFEDTSYSTFNNSSIKLFLDGTGYRQLALDLDQSGDYTNLSAVFTESQKGEAVMMDYYDMLFQSQDHTFGAVSLVSAKESSTIFINFMAVILIGFSLVMVFVTIIVIRFQISTSIEDDINNIGILKAIGYTGSQINKTLILQFLTVTIVAAIPGIIASYALMPFIGNIITSSVGLLWSLHLEWIINLCSLFFIAGLVSITAFFSSRRTKRITPVIAIRGGVQTHNFQKNFFPIEQTKGSIHWILSLKGLAVSFRQNIIIIVIVAALTFACLFSSVLYDNINSKNDAVVSIIGFEQANVTLYPKNKVDKEKLYHSISDMDGVRKTSTLDILTGKVDNMSIVLQVSDDFSKLETNTVFKGRQPLYDNEIAISSLVAKKINKKIGEEITIELNQSSKPFLITGISQGVSQLGKVANVTLSGIQRMQPEYNRVSLNVYLDATSTEEYITKLEKQYGDQLDAIYNVEEGIQSTLDSFTQALFLMMLLIITATVIVVTLILYLVIKSIILRRRKEFGILKSVGYTTLNLMTQLSFSLMPILILGVTIGGVFGYYCTNSVIELLMSGMSIYNAEFIVRIPIVLSICIGILIAGYIVSMLVSRRIKKISVYELISE